MLRKSFILSILTLITLTAFSQKKFEAPDVYYKWNSLSDQKISKNGEIISWEVNKLKGDGYLHILQPQKDQHDSVYRAGDAQLSPAGDFVAFSIKPHYDTLRQLELDGVPKKKFPHDSLGILNLSNGNINKFPAVKSFKVPGEETAWIAWLHEKPVSSKKERPDTTETADSLTTDTTKETLTGEKLVIYHPASGFRVEYDQVDRYEFSRNGQLLLFSQKIKQEEEDQQDSIKVWVFNTGNRQARGIFEGAGEIKDIAVDRQGDSFAFIFSDDTSEVKDYHLYLNEKKIADTTLTFLQPNHQISEHSILQFSRDGSRLLFETRQVPEPEAEDSLTAEEKYHVDIWHWKDSYLQPQQKIQKKKEMTRDYLAFYDLKKKKFIQIENEKIKRAFILKDNNSEHAYGFVSEPYRRQISWTGKRYKDIWYINLKSGERKKILEKHANRTSWSPAGRYMVYYDESDSSWWALDIKKDSKVNLTKELNIPFYNIDHDTPNQPYAIGTAGWDKNQKVYIYDRYDIWKMDPAGKEKPENITAGYGRRNRMQFRYIKADREAHFLPETLLLRLFDKENKDAGFARANINDVSAPKILYKGAFMVYGFSKADNSQDIIFRKGNFREYPDLWLSSMDFDDPQRISHANPQQSEYLWGTVETTAWVNANGDSLSGLIYKPENFDPEKKYPMIVYFYERYADRKHAHYIPKPSHSVINFTRYVNDGYIIFIPDIKYKEGYPGKSAEDAVISGTLHMIGQGYVDKDRLGMQGQSWGGYQVAHLITRTDMFAAAMAGAPVSNMTSAYGGMRWGSGMSRAFQYERTQSRIGATLWEKPRRYIENSPVFYLPEVTTPLLIMHNDQDGAVPWYQGIELFNGLRRLDKVAYMLVYNNDKHNLRHWGNRIDLSIRMKQFFDHYLKHEPMPLWMKEGLPATEKYRKSGYKLTD